MADDLIYLDYAASTPVDPRVYERMREVGVTAYANPSSTHAAGRLTHEIIAAAAAQVGGLLNVDPNALIWTSGATESDNLAIAGAARYRAHKGKHIVTMKTEHKAVTDVFDALTKEGFEVSWVEPDSRGLLDPAAFSAALRDDTQFASIMFVNNETGVIQDIEDAISFAIENGNVDTKNIHVIGASGGGYATLLTYMNTRFPIKTFSAWVPISDLKKWYYPVSEE